MEIADKHGLQHNVVYMQDATLSQGVPRDAAVNFSATGIMGVADIKKTDGSTHHCRKRLVQSPPAETRAWRIGGT